MRTWPLFLAAVALALSSPVCAAESGCFIKEGDRVGFFGDSITEAKVYGQVAEQVFRHFHPAAKVEFINNGHSGLQLAGTTLETVIAGDPTVVVIMIGMNDAINGQWVRGMPTAPVVEAYKAKLGNLVKEVTGRGKRVVLLTPTATDETAALSCFRTEGTALLLKAMGAACQEVATAESVICLDVQSDFERYEQSLPRFAQLRPDGVHPCARGHYRIAHALWTQLNFSGSLTGKSADAPAELDVDLTLTANQLPVGSEALACVISAPTSGPATITWSAGAVRGSESVQLSGSTAWKLALPAQAWPQAAGKSMSVVVDIANGGARKCFIVDVFRKMVVHGKDGTAAGLVSDADGVPRASFSFRKAGEGLVFEAAVTKPELFHSDADQWPWGQGDALTLYLDIRPAAKLGGLGFDGEVYQVWFKPQDKPFSPGFIASSGKHMANIATVSGERTRDGYSVGLRMDGYINIKEPLDVSDRDFIGMDLTVIYAAALGKQAWLGLQAADRQNFLFPGSFALVDLNGKIREDSVLTASIFPDRP